LFSYVPHPASPRLELEFDAGPDWSLEISCAAGTGEDVAMWEEARRRRGRRYCWLRKCILGWGDGMMDFLLKGYWEEEGRMGDL